MEIKRIDDEAKHRGVETYFNNCQLASRTNYKDGVKQQN